MEDLEETLKDKLSETEYKYLNFVFKRLDFKDNAFRYEYIMALDKKAKRTLPEKDRYRSIRVVYFDIIEELSFKKMKIHYEKNEPTELADSPIVLLRKKDNEIGLNFITATDISSFVYCPVSFAINKTFNEPLDPNADAKAQMLGTQYHEQNRLAYYVKGGEHTYAFTPNADKPAFYTSYNKSFFDDVRSSKLFYLGHSENKIRYFKSSKGKYIGQPDYIFTSASGKNFIVEEKFIDARKNFAIRDNHKAQLASYVLGLDEIDASYGYLVYWLYTYVGDQRKMEKCIIHKFERNEADATLIRDIYKQIDKLNSGIPLHFDADDIDAAKCASCVSRLYCGHKTGNFSEITVPYDKKYYALKN